MTQPARLASAIFVLWVTAAASAQLPPDLPTPPPVDLNKARGSGDYQRPRQVDLPARYLESYLALFPSRATAAGDHRSDRRLEDLSEKRLLGWLSYNKNAAREMEALLRRSDLTPDQRIDYQVLLRQARRVVFELDVQKRHLHDPLFWTAMFSDAATYLLMREDRPLDQRLFDLAERIALLPNLVRAAHASLYHGDPKRRAPEHFERAIGQTKALAAFYRDGFARPANDLPPGPDRERLRAQLPKVGARAAAALDSFAEDLVALEADAKGDFRIAGYPQLFRVVTGLDESLDRVLMRAEMALDLERAEAARHCRQHWAKMLGSVEQPQGDDEVVRLCFERIARDRAASVDEFVADYQRLVVEAKTFVEKHRLMTLPPKLEVSVDRSPAFFGGAAFGGISPPGPFSPDGPSLLRLPTPPADADPERLAGFFRDFNHAFNVMITPHETVPGHAAQMTLAAHGPSRLRAIFADGVYVEGWGTFSERLMLDAGWGDELARTAHLKKQLENIARVIVDIRVHTRGMTREQVIELVRGKAHQDEQFALNMWQRTQTSAPQITTYWLGYQAIQQLYHDVRAARGKIEVREFTDTMMSLGPVPIRHYRDLFFPPPATPKPAPAKAPAEGGSAGGR